MTWKSLTIDLLWIFKVFENVYLMVIKIIAQLLHVLSR
jgi:hypothetical protein